MGCCLCSVEANGSFSTKMVSYRFRIWIERTPKKDEHRCRSMKFHSSVSNLSNYPTSPIKIFVKKFTKICINSVITPKLNEVELQENPGRQQVSETHTEEKKEHVNFYEKKNLHHYVFSQRQFCDTKKFSLSSLTQYEQFLLQQILCYIQYILI